MLSGTPQLPGEQDPEVFDSPIANQRFLESAGSQEAPLNLYLWPVLQRGKAAGTVFPAHSSQPHGAPSADSLFQKALRAPPEPLVFPLTRPNPRRRRHLPPLRTPPNQRAPRKRRKPGVPGGGAPRNRPHGDWSEAGHVTTVLPRERAQSGSARP